MKPGAFFRFLLRAALGSLFAVSGFQKLVSPSQNFAAVIEKFEIIQGPTADILSRALPWAELLGGILLILGLWTPIALTGLWLMNTVFIGVLISALWRKLPLDQCGCFGKDLSVPLPVMLAIDLGLWALFLLCFLIRKKQTPSLDDFLAGHD